MPKKKAVKQSKAVTIADHPNAALIKKYNPALTDIDTFTEEIAYSFRPEYDDRGKQLTIKIDTFQIEPDGKAAKWDGQQQEDLVIGETAQPPDPPEDILDDDGVTVLVPAGFFRSAIPTFTEFLTLPVPGQQKLALTNQDLLDNLSSAINAFMPVAYPQLAGTVVELEE